MFILKIWEISVLMAKKAEYIHIQVTVVWVLLAIFKLLDNELKYLNLRGII